MIKRIAICIILILFARMVFAWAYTSKIYTTEETHIMVNALPSSTLVDKSTENLIDFTYDQNLIIHSQSMEDAYTIVMGPSSINQTFQIQSVELEHLGYRLLTTSCTDWIGPFMVKALVGSHASVPRFTGGWHGSNGDTTGEPTSVEQSRIVFTDLGIVREGQKGSTNRLFVLLKNDVKAYNSSEYVLSEYLLYSFSPSGVAVKASIYALKDVAIERYYGIQTQNSAFNGSVVYQFRNGSTTEFPIDQLSQSGSIDAKNPVQSFSLTCADSPITLNAYLDSSASLIANEHTDKIKPGAFTTAYGKSYFNLINGIPLNMEVGDFFTWSGGYRYIEQ